MLCIERSTTKRIYDSLLYYDDYHFSCISNSSLWNTIDERARALRRGMQAARQSRIHIEPVADGKHTHLSWFRLLAEWVIDVCSACLIRHGHTAICASILQAHSADVFELFLFFNGMRCLHRHNRFHANPITCARS